jgi:hypothetical protein
MRHDLGHCFTEQALEGSHRHRLRPFLRLWLGLFRLYRCRRLRRPGISLSRTPLLFLLENPPDDALNVGEVPVPVCVARSIRPPLERIA